MILMCLGSETDFSFFFGECQAGVPWGGGCEGRWAISVKIRAM